MGKEDDRLLAEINSLARLKGEKLESFRGLTEAMAVSLQQENIKDFEKTIGQRKVLMDEVNALDSRCMAFCRKLDHPRRDLIQSILSGVSVPETLPAWTDELAELVQKQQQTLRDIIDLDSKNRLKARKMLDEVREQLKSMGINRSVVSSYTHSKIPDGNQTGRVLDKKE